MASSEANRQNISETSHRFYERLVAIAIVGSLVITGCTVTDKSPSPKHQINANEINLLGGEWRYLPGATVTKSGLDIKYLGVKIAEQDGTGGQPDPAVNEYGTRLDVRGDFEINTSFKAISGPATMRLYGSPPEVSDEFRFETPSIAFTINGNQLTESVWDGKSTQDLSKQLPTAVNAQFFAANGDTVNLHVVKDSEGVAVSINGSSLIPVGNASRHIFDSGEVWFGFDTANEGGNFTVSQLSAAAVNSGQLIMIDTASEPPVSVTPTGLQQLATRRRPGFLIGSNIALWSAVASPSYNKMIFGGDFGIVTPENAMKWQFVEPQQGQFDFHEADALVNMARKNHLQIHGHNLVFSEALPRWVRDLPAEKAADKAHVKQVLYNHVYALVGHFKGRVNEWDINEPFSHYDDANQLPDSEFTDNVFFRALGEDYIRVASQAAVAADPNVKLWINDFGAENDTGIYWSHVFNSLKKWKVDWRLPIYGFGFESHIYDPSSDDIATSIDKNGRMTLTNHFEQLATIGIKSRISEMDAPLQNAGYVQDNSSQANEFSRVLTACINDPSCIAFSTWSNGMTDIWQSDTHALEDGSTDSAYGTNNQPVGSTYKALQQLLR